MNPREELAAAIEAVMEDIEHQQRTLRALRRAYALLEAETKKERQQ